MRSVALILVCGVFSAAANAPAPKVLVAKVEALNPGQVICRQLSVSQGRDDGDASASRILAMSSLCRA